MSVSSTRPCLRRRNSSDEALVSEAMSATKTLVPWQGFRHSNIISTSAPTQARTSTGYDDDSDGAEKGGFLGTGSNGSQEMVMMETMDRYVQAGPYIPEGQPRCR